MGGGRISVRDDQGLDLYVNIYEWKAEYKIKWQLQGRTDRFGE